MIKKILLKLKQKKIDKKTENFLVEILTDFRMKKFNKAIERLEVMESYLRNNGGNDDITSLDIKKRVIDYYFPHNQSALADTPSTFVLPDLKKLICREGAHYYTTLLQSYYQDRSYVEFMPFNKNKDAQIFKSMKWYLEEISYFIKKGELTIPFDMEDWERKACKVAAKSNTEEGYKAIATALDFAKKSHNGDCIKDLKFIQTKLQFMLQRMG